MSSGNFATIQSSVKWGQTDFVADACPGVFRSGDKPSAGEIDSKVGVLPVYSLCTVVTAPANALALSVLPIAAHVLDWFHLTRHLTILERALFGEEAIEPLPSHHHDPLCKDLTSLK